MAPDRGTNEDSAGAEAQPASKPARPIPTVDLRSPSSASNSPTSPDVARTKNLTRSRSDCGAYLRRSQSLTSATTGTNFTLRGVLAGSLIGVVICFSNTYFGLQTGWVSGMAMPSSLIGFAVFKSLSRHLKLPFSPVENVLIQTVAGAVGTMPLGCGFVGVIPALDFLLKKSEGAPIELGMWKLIVWSFGICLFGVVFAVPLRKEVIIREKLKFPSGTATALMIGVLHGQNEKTDIGRADTQDTSGSRDDREGDALLSQSRTDDARPGEDDDHGSLVASEEDERGNWKRQIRLMIISFVISAFYTLIAYFIPMLRSLPVFGLPLARNWLWTLNPSPAYVGQGIIMGPSTTLHMLFGAIFGWGILSPMAKNQGWAPGDVDNWENGSKGWIVWVSLAIMLADSLVNLGWLIAKTLIEYGPSWIHRLRQGFRERTWEAYLPFPRHPWQHQYSILPSSPASSLSNHAQPLDSKSLEPDDDAPPQHLVSTRTVLILLPATLLICILCIHFSFGDLIPIPLTLLSVILALFLSIMGVRALGETDLNPVSGISKLTQLIFALVTPPSLSDRAVVINLLAGAVSESGALQAGDMMQDLKTGHLLNASPKAQFYGQLIGSVVGAVVSAAVYRLYVSVYTIPGGLFQVPTGYVWIFTARLVTGKGLPEKVEVWALWVGGVWAVLTVLRIYLAASLKEGLEKDKSSGRLRAWKRAFYHLVPGGIAVAVGMYNTPSFTLARTVGGLVSWYWVNWRKREETRVIVLASGLILGEGVVSIVNLILASGGVPHL